MKIVLLCVIAVCLTHYTQAQNKRCVANAAKNAAGQCECDAGYNGNGELCCLPDDHKLCMVEGDPTVWAMNGDLIPLDTPCPTMIAEVHTVGPVYDETVYAYVAGEYGSNGILNFNYLRLVYEERYNDIHTEIHVYNGELTINGVKHDKTKPWFSELYAVEFNHTDSTDTYAMLSMGTTIVHFVPPSKDTDDQITLPGICVGVAKNALLYDVGMCNQRRRGLQRSSINRGFPFLNAGVVEHVIRRLPLNEDIGPVDVQNTCEGLNRMRTPCGDRWNPAIAACFTIVSHPDIRYCLDTLGLDVLHVFSECTRAHCSLSQDSCSYVSSSPVTKCIKITADCKPLYQQLK